MKITPVSITLQGFRSFSCPTTFGFPKIIPAFCLITGWNEAEPNLGSNAAGKSTLWSALFYCLYGKSERGLSANDLRSWTGDEPLKVRFDFLRDGKPGFIERTPKPVIVITLFDDGVSRQVSQAELEAWLGMGADVFQQAVFAGQYSNMFLDLGPAEKQKFISSLMDLDRWESYRQLAAKEELNFQETGTKIQTKVESTKAVLVQVEKEHAQCETDCRAWEHRKQERLAQAKIDVENACSDVNMMRNTKLEFSKTFKTEDIALVKTAIDKSIAEEAALEITSSQMQMLVGEVRGEISALQASTRTYNTLAASNYVCPTCKQPADSQHIIAELDRARQQGIALQQKQKDLTAEANKNANKRKQIVEKRRSLEARMKSVEQDKTRFDQRLQNFDLEIKKLELHVARHEQRFAEIQKETNVYEPILRKHIEKLRTLNEELVRLGTEVKVNAQQLGLATFWKKGFKEIQLFLLAEAVAQLEMSYNSALASLGMADWKIQLLVEHETKSGSIQNKFLIFICPPGRADPVPWEAWSGGESQRLRLACAFGTFDLVSQLTGVTWDLEVWDEPTTHLSDEGTEDLLEILRQRTALLNKQIFLIDHKRIQYGNFDYSYRIVKTKDGSHIEH